MKRKIQLLTAMLFMACGASFAQTQMVTFQVQSPATTPVYVFGSWSGWTNWPGTPMISLGSGKYSVTLAVASNTTHEYLFVNGTTPVKETLASTGSCMNGNTQFTNRVLSVGSTDTAVCYTWETCNTCTITPPPPPPAPVNVTFQVESPDSTPVYVIGSWNWSNFPGAQMTLVSPNKYSVTLPLTASTAFEYLFVNGTQTKEVLNPVWTCTNGNAQYTNRILSVGTVDTAFCNTWATCNNCTVVPPPSNVNIKFQVENPDSTPVYLFGSWNNWNNFPGELMTSIGGGIHEVSIPLSAITTYEYLYVNGTQTKEILNPAWSCTNGNGQFTNRTLAVGTSPFTTCNKWSSCDSCGSIVPSNINVSFAVQNPDSTPVFVFGSWSNWSNFPGSPMILNGTTGYYEATIPMASGTSVEYLYVNGVGTKEVLDATGSCTNGNTQFTNRVAQLGIVDTSFCNKWESCDACGPVNVQDILNEDISILISQESFTINSKSISELDQLEIFDLLGKRVYNFKFGIKTNTAIPVQLQTNAIYFIRGKSGNQYFKLKTMMK